MESNNKRKARLLGEPYGTANNKLRKAILFKLIKETNNDVCYRCGKKIEDIDNLSIEHKISWERSKDPVKTFYDLDNISFSHLKCNVAAAKRDVPHPNGRGENNGMSKLKKDDVLGIREELKKGISQISIAKKYNVSTPNIRNIKERRTWRHV